MTKRLALPLLCAATLLGMAGAPALADEDTEAGAYEVDAVELGNGMETRLALRDDLSEECEAELSAQRDSEAERREALDACLVVTTSEPVQG